MQDSDFGFSDLLQNRSQDSESINKVLGLDSLLVLRAVVVHRNHYIRSKLIAEIERIIDPHYHATIADGDADHLSSVKPLGRQNFSFHKTGVARVVNHMAVRFD